MKNVSSNSDVSTITKTKKTIFTIIAICLPLIIILMLELGLRISNYGPDLSLFTTKTINGKLYYVMNPSVKDRYFDQINFTPSTSSDYFQVDKPKETYRIFCLGGSTTVGYPYWYNGSFSSFLRDRLNATFPDKQLEVINIGITATNSFTVLDLYKEVINYSPDLIIVYDGHNEFYGAMGVSSNEGRTKFRLLTQLHLKLIHFRTYQLVRNTISWISELFGKNSGNELNQSTMMEQVSHGKNIPINSEEYYTALDWFKENLTEIVELCAEKKIPIIMCTQVSNLKDLPPFISNTSNEVDRIKFRKILSKANKFMTECQIDSAMIEFKRLIKIDKHYASAHFYLGQCLLLKGKINDALNEFTLARNYDELRFRTASQFNDLIRSFSSSQNCYTADIEKIFNSSSQGGIVGKNLILEHLHPNIRGHFLIAKEIVRIMREGNLYVKAEEWIQQDTISDATLWTDRHITEVDELIARQRVNYLTSGWPFKNQTPTDQQVNESDTLKFLASQAVHNKLGWNSLHLKAAEFYLHRKDSANVEMELKTIINQFPLDASNYLKLARIQFDRKVYNEAEKVVKSSLRLERTPVAFRALGDIYLRQQKFNKAVAAYEEINNFQLDVTTYLESNYFLAIAYLITNQNEKALSLLKSINQNYPDYKPIRDLLLRAKGTLGIK